MKLTLLSIVLIALIMSTSAKIKKFDYHNGDEILRALQTFEADDKAKTYVLFFFNEPGYNRDLRTTNDYFKDRLKTEVIEKKGDETEYTYAEVDATDKFGNGYLVDRLGVKKDVLNENPVIVVMKNGKGNVISGPTAIDSITKALEKLKTPPPPPAGGSGTTTSGSGSTASGSTASGTGSTTGTK
uniref:Uncharacterized protein n=1 Tax=Euplotes harpa TaxID=151035 RepID=A0A7S3IYQ4_9SPIT|mmetsp:Transcript_10307/g.11544  ORF Transcript_10307/g.11544 Transcript_10307/m.11544 type:complete len:185 (+) Transcript_10307:13-567(+)